MNKAYIDIEIVFVKLAKQALGEVELGIDSHAHIHGHVKNFSGRIDVESNVLAR